MVVLSPEFAFTIKRADGVIAKVGTIVSAKVTMTRKKPADEFEVELPEAKDFTLDLFSKGDEVDFSLGFKEFIILPLFRGAIKEIEPSLPLKIKATSKAEAARATTYSVTYEGQTWIAIAHDAMRRAGLTPDAIDVVPATAPPAKYRVDNQTPAQVLDACARETGWTWYAVAGTARGFFGPRWLSPKDNEGDRRWLFEVGRNAYDDDADVKYEVKRRIGKVTVVLADADHLVAAARGEYKAPTFKEGDAARLVQREVAAPTAAMAGALAKEEYLRLSPAGFTGKFKAIGNPYIRPGVPILFRHPKYDGNARETVVENVTHSYDDGAYDIEVDLAGSNKDE